MKKFALLTAVATFGLMGLGIGQIQAATTTNGLVSTFAIVGWFSPTNSPVTTTNSNGTVITQKYTAKPVKITTKDLLNLLGTEFGATFPHGAQIVYGIGPGFLVDDKNGNVVLNVSSNLADSSYVFTLDNVTNTSSIETVSGSVTETMKPTSTNTVEVVTAYVSDEEITYADGNGNNFHFSGTAVEKANVTTTPTPLLKSITVTLPGAGGGTFFNPVDNNYDEGVFTKATWNATGKNLPGGL